MLLVPEFFQPRMRLGRLFELQKSKPSVPVVGNLFRLFYIALTGVGFPGIQRLALTVGLFLVL